MAIYLTGSRRPTAVLHREAAECRPGFVGRTAPNSHCGDADTALGHIDDEVFTVYPRCRSSGTNYALSTRCLRQHTCDRIMAHVWLRSTYG